MFHVVFSTKERQSLIAPPLQEELYKYIGGIVRGEEGSLIEIGGISNHVHLAVRLKDHAAPLGLEGSCCISGPGVGLPAGTPGWQNLAPLAHGSSQPQNISNNLKRIVSISLKRNRGEH